MLKALSLFPEKMCKVKIVAEKSLKKRIIDLLYDLKVLHIEEIKFSDFMHDAQVDIENLDKYSEMLINLESALNEMKEAGYVIENTGGRISENKLLKYEKDVHALEEMFRKLKKLREEYERLNRIYIEAERLRKLGVHDLNILRDNKPGVGFILVSIKDLDKTAEILRKNGKSVISFNHYFDEDAKRHFMLIMYKGKEEDILNSIDEQVIRKYDLESILNLLQEYGSNTKEILDKVVHKKAKLISAIKDLEETIKKKYVKKKDELSALLNTLQHVIDKYEQIDKFKESKSLFYVTGYVPCKDSDRLVRALKRISPNIYIEVHEVERGEDVPVKIEHTRFVNPFRVFLDIYALPKYRYIDPTLLMFFTFPLFYGFILGDIGYGLVLGIFAYILKKKTPKGSVMNNLAKVMLLSASSSIFFGFLFGEFFGFEKIGDYELHSYLHRMHEIKELIGISILFGLIHINLGLILGIYQKIRYKEYWHALTEKFSWILLQIGVGLVAYKYIANASDFYAYTGYVVIVTSIVLIYLGEGLKGLFELPGILSNLLSYARLGAVGLSSIAIAYVINLFVEQFIESGSIGGYVAAIVLFLVGHTFNILLGIIGPFLHALRLHYVEFFTKFYEGGGKEYKPYGILDNDHRR
ncbi:MAG: V-type ATP synthase subunit I [Candidatus Nanohaloarchaeota archaeon]|nr:V-type ATP synthase subunit I [Candidatus Nanohaloarchaeota archaeon]